MRFFFFSPLTAFRLVAGGIVILPVLVLAQLDTAGRGPDDIFLRARDRAAEGNYREARVLAQIVLSLAPKYYDAAILIARTYAWEKRYDSARAILKRVLLSAPSNSEAFDAISDVEMWDERYVESLKFLLQALKLFPRNQSFLAKRVRALSRLGRSAEAETSFADFAKRFPSDPAIPVLRSELHAQPSLNTVSLVFGLDSYIEYFSPTHSVSLGYQYLTATGPLSLHVNGLRRFMSTGGQVDIEWYPKISRTTSAYVGYAWSTSPMFPTHRVGIEGSLQITDRVEVGLGGRGLVYLSKSPVWLGTISTTLYSGAWYINLRPFLAFRSSRSAFSAVMNLRYYPVNEQDYLFCRTGIGSSADERFLQTTSGSISSEQLFLAMQFVVLGTRQSLGGNFTGTAEAGFLRQELAFLPGSYVSALTGSIGVSYSF